MDDSPRHPPPPPLPPKPAQDRTENSQASVLAILTLLFLVGTALAISGLVCGPIFFLLLTIPALALLHYLLWGWWMGKMIDKKAHQEEE